jgi:hypothetical protein
VHQISFSIAEVYSTLRTAIVRVAKASKFPEAKDNGGAHSAIMLRQRN